MRTVTTPKKLFFISILVTISIWTAAGLLFWFIFDEKSKTLSLADEIFSMSSRGDEIKILAQELSSLENDLKKLDTFIVDNSQEGVVKFLKTLENASEISQTEISIDLDVVQAKDTEPEEDFERLNLKLEVIGDWDNLFHFLNLLENLQYQTKINELNFSFVPAIGEIRQYWKGQINMEALRMK